MNLFITSCASSLLNNMELSSPHMKYAVGDAHIITYIDNAKSLSSTMARSNESPGTTARSSSRAPLAEDREPLLGLPDEHHLIPSDGNPAAEPLRKRAGVVGLAIIVLSRLFNTIVATCTIYGAIRLTNDGWNYWINRLLFSFCCIILVWNIFALITSIINCPVFSVFSRKRGNPVSSFRNKLRIWFACNDAALGLIILSLLAMACHAISSHWGERFEGPRPPIMVMVSVLIGAEFFTAMIQLHQ
ncbi:hypothetical protein F4814DRAFT_438504 [Daldinia grandis]|nr:hypothetical protein F4814DRAFT_438504 [Daldinia grandis]